MDGYNPRKAAQVIAYLALKGGGRIYVLSAIKMVYLADRESLKRYGFPILDDNYVSMPHGPVNSLTCSYVRGEMEVDSCGWSTFLDAKENHQVAAASGVDVDSLDELSEADCACLDAVWGQFGTMNRYRLRDWTHDNNNVPEWEDPNGSSSPIPLKRILQNLEIPNASAQLDEIMAQRQIDTILESLRQCPTTP